MAPDSYQARRRELGDALRQLRKSAGLSGQQAAQRTGMSQSKISRLESGRLVPNVPDTETLADLLGAPPEVKEHLLALAADVNTHTKSLRLLRQRGLGGVQRAVGRLEASTRVLRVFVPHVVPGLLQTEAYARALLTRPLAPPLPDLAAAVAARLGRQAILTDTQREFRFVLTESALRSRIAGADVMAEQMHRLIEATRWPNIRLGIIPWTARLPEVARTDFTLHDDRAVLIETFTAGITITDPRDIHLYLRIFAAYEDIAVGGRDTRQILADLTNTYRSSRE